MEGKKPSKADSERALKILARSVYRNLTENGYGEHDIMAFTSSVLEILTSSLREQRAE